MQTSPAPIASADTSAGQRAQFVREQMPKEGLFAGHEWRVAPAPFKLGPDLGKELDLLGRVLLQFYRAVNLLYRKSVDGKQPAWVAQWLDQGKPQELIELQRSPALKNDVPRVIRPDLLLTEHGLSVTELDSVPGGIGLTAWLNQIYSSLGASVIGGKDGMIRGFESIFGDAAKVHIIVSEEAATYRPEMTWVAKHFDGNKFQVQNADFKAIGEGEQSIGSLSCSMSQTFPPPAICLKWPWKEDPVDSASEAGL